MNQQSENCIAPEILKKELEKGMDVLVIDVRSKDEFEEKHIPLALNIPIENLESEIRKFNEHYTLVTVCGKGGGRSAAAAEKLRLIGRDAKWLCGGTYGYFEN